MLAVQACQQHRHVVIQSNKAKSVPAATLVHYRRVERGTRSEEIRDAPRAHARKQKCPRSRSRDVLGVLHPTRRKNESKNLSRKHLELRERRGAFARRKRPGKRAERKAARMKNKTARARSRLDKLTFGTFNVRTAVVNGVNGIGHIDTLLRPCVAKGFDVGLQETKRDGTPELVASGYRVCFSGDCSGTKGRNG